MKEKAIKNKETIPKNIWAVSRLATNIAVTIPDINDYNFLQKRRRTFILVPLCCQRVELFFSIYNSISIFFRFLGERARKIALQHPCKAFHTTLPAFSLTSIGSNVQVNLFVIHVITSAQLRVHQRHQNVGKNYSSYLMNSHHPVMILLLPKIYFISSESGGNSWEDFEPQS